MITNKKLKVLFCGCLLANALIGCNKNAKRYNAKTINPELIGTWTSSDNCFLKLKKENDSLILVNYRNNKSPQINNIPLSFKLYSIATELSNKNESDSTFAAKYIDGSIIINNNVCQPLQKIQ